MKMFRDDDGYSFEEIQALRADITRKDLIIKNLFLQNAKGSDLEALALELQAKGVSEEACLKELKSLISIYKERETQLKVAAMGVYIDKTKGSK